MRYSGILTALKLACLRRWVSKFNCLVKLFVALYQGWLHSFAVFVRFSSVSLKHCSGVILIVPMCAGKSIEYHKYRLYCL